MPALRRNQQTNLGFTIVELLIVIVVIGILAAVVLLAYNGIQNNARVATLQSDLQSAYNVLSNDNTTTTVYPATLAAANNGQGITPTAGNTYNYSVNNTTSPSTFCLTETNTASGISYKITSTNSIPTAGSCSGVMSNGVSCPSGFIDVPANPTFSQAEFCVAKYEMKQVSATVPISQASGTPWVSLTQANAITYSANVAGCVGCHLITDNEWLTIAANVLSVASNWSGGSVGSGYIYSGHNDNAPATSLAADTNDANGYSGETNTGGNQRRTLTLTNGEIIWDFAGNVSEWVNATIAGGQQPGLSGESTYVWKQYNNGALLQNGLPSMDYPSYGTPAASSWTSSQGIGELWSDYGETTVHGFTRGGIFNYGADAGVLALGLTYAPSATSSGVGFRVSR